jgi:tetrahydromethanopterin S-methyltransferase subunit F
MSARQKRMATGIAAAFLDGVIQTAIPSLMMVVIFHVLA